MQHYTVSHLLLCNTKKGDVFVSESAPRRAHSADYRSYNDSFVISARIFLSFMWKKLPPLCRNFTSFRDTETFISFRFFFFIKLHARTFPERYRDFLPRRKRISFQYRTQIDIYTINWEG